MVHSQAVNPCRSTARLLGQQLGTWVAPAGERIHGIQDDVFIAYEEVGSHSKLTQPFFEKFMDRRSGAPSAG